MIAAKNYAAIAGLVACLLIILAVIGSKESFVSGGTLVQLETSHVPTADELRSPECMGGLYRCVYRWIPFGF